MRTKLLSIFGVLLCAAAADADVLHLKNGERVAGKLTFCDEEVCSIDKRRISTAEIAQIELRALDPVPLAARAGGVVLSDGSVRTGQFTGLTLGYVEVSGEEIDRADVALIVLSPVNVADIIVEREGAQRTGALTACNAASCTFDGEMIPLVRIAWIGLGQEAQTPPAANGNADLIFVRDGDPVTARLSALDATTVRTTRGSFPRAGVTWIHVAARSADAPPGTQPGTERPPEGTPPPAAEPPPAPPSGQAPPRPPSPPANGQRSPRERNREPVKPCPADRVLGGAIEYDYSIADRHYQRCSGSARMWFHLYPAPLAWPYRLGGPWLSDAITYRLKLHGCTDLPDQWGEVCTGPPQDEVRARAVIGTVGAGGVEPIAGADWGPVSFDPLVPELYFVTLPDAIRHDPSLTPITCVLPGGGGSSSWGLQVIGRITAWGNAPCDSDSHAAAACVQPTLCTDATDPEQKRDCAAHPDRYAVIPFTGSQRAVTTESAGVGVPGTVQTWDLRWKVCCGCGEPPSGPPPEMSQDPCGDLGAYRGRMQVAVDTSAALRRLLKPHMDKYLFEKEQARQWRNDFEYVSNSCAGWDIAVMLTEALFGGTGAAEGLGPTEGAQAFSKLLSIIQAVIEQDPTIPLTAFLGAAEDLEVAGETALEVSLLGIEGFTASEVIDTVNTIAGGALEFLNSGEVQAQRERLEDCTDVPLVAGVTFDGAREYLNHAEAAARELSQILPLMTRIEQSDTDIYNKWHQYHQACVQYAQCSGRDPRVCNPPPP